MDQVRVIPCLDILDGRVVKGINFVDIKDAGDPIETAAIYSKSGADEIFFLDISATVQGRGVLLDLVKQIAKNIDVPLIVGGGIRAISDMKAVLKAGAEKVCISSAAVENPSLIKEASEHFGSQKIVVAIDAKRRADGGYNVYRAGGSIDAGLDAVEWAVEVEQLGAGEVLLNSMDADGTKNGYDKKLTKAISDAVTIPVIASGGAGKLEHFVDAVTEGAASAVLAASLFHYGDLTIPEVKRYLQKKGIPVRMEGSYE
ncbi:MAG TPA: imidazole glycerol phosphate synthase subunit HisF [Bacillota bacterium]|nr:imidazole glycerol phosphate synthase subunit HisF [Bacillota bacterium]